MKKMYASMELNPHRWEHGGKRAGGYGGPQKDMLGDNNREWFNMYFWEFPFDFRDLRPNTYCKMNVEIKDDKYHAFLAGKETEEKGDVGLRLAYQPKPGLWIPIEGSEIFHEGGVRWHLARSKWFRMPNKSSTDYQPFDNVVLLWIQGYHEEGSNLGVAMVNLIFAEEVPDDED